MSGPKGTLVAIGGREDKEDDMVILRRVLDEVKGNVKHVEIIAAASREPREAAQPYLRAFEELDIERVDYLELQSRREVEERRTEERLEEADVIYFTGGDQVRLVDAFRGTRALDIIRERYEGGAVIAGTSAGAAAMSETMLARGDPEEGLNKGNTETAPGLGLLPHAIIDTH
ncbi:MAG TPA: cyanophycinase, partial [Candidatus Thermoplasmatota archaeon]|nr:cyanophycinase [Candidatus Thermoplasmatota archaeon]